MKEAFEKTDSVVSVVRAETYSYEDGFKIKKAVNEALERIHAAGIIKPGMTVLIKPNWVMDVNHDVSSGTDCLYTQAAVIDPIIEFVCDQLKGDGKIILGDAPMQECVFENLKGIHELAEKYRSKVTELKLIDFRELKSVVFKGIHRAEINPNSSGIVVNLGHDSEFYDVSAERLSKMRITNYDPRILLMHHTGEIQEYYVSKYVLQADVIVNVPKPKSHRKAGVTIALKNLVGINTRKEYLPHHTMGSVGSGGDEYLKKSLVHSIRSRVWDKRNICEANGKYGLARVLQYINIALSIVLKYTNNPYSEGSWYGNNTISRTITDLNIIAKYANRQGRICNTPQRKMIILADMIVSGEKEGPVCPTPKNVGIIAAGLNSVCFDEAISTLMGFDYRKIPSIVTARARQGRHQLVDKNEHFIISSNDKRFNEMRFEELSRSKDLLGFMPTSGWLNHIEIE